MAYRKPKKVLSTRLAPTTIRKCEQIFSPFDVEVEEALADVDELFTLAVYDTLTGVSVKADRKTVSFKPSSTEKERTCGPPRFRSLGQIRKAAQLADSAAITHLL